MLPLYYTSDDGKYEIRYVIEAYKINFNLGNVLKYVVRAGKKEQALKDLQKARDYLDFEIERLSK